MTPGAKRRSPARRVADAVATVLEGLPFVLAVAILAAAVAGFVASRTGDGDGVAAAALAAAGVGAILTVVVLVARERRRPG